MARMKTKMTDPEKKRLSNFLGRITAWVIDVGRAIKSGDLDDRAAAIEQARNSVDDFAQFVDGDDTDGGEE